MRFQTVAALALALTPAVSAAAGRLGFALGTKKADGSCKTTADYAADFDAISGASSAKVVRGYAASDCDCAKNILPAAKSKGFQVVLGIWCVAKISLSSWKSVAGGKLIAGLTIGAHIGRILTPRMRWIELPLPTTLLNTRIRCTPSL
jgi:exo-beta-1,3-glucanase (GH17 family)